MLGKARIAVLVSGGGTNLQALIDAQKKGILASGEIVLVLSDKADAYALTRAEKAAIRKLVTRLCANYDRDVGCLPLDCPCYMLEKCWTGALCRYFREAVLPNDPVLEASLAAEGPAPETRPCPVCGRAFLPDGRTRYCSSGCAKAARLKKQRGYMRKYRG